MSTQDPQPPHSPDGMPLPALEAAGRAVPYGVPTDYFESLSDRMVAGVRAAEGVDTEVALPETPAPMDVPAGYFDELPGMVMNRVRPKPSAPVRKIALIRPLRYAAAAMALLAAGVGFWLVDRPVVSTPTTVAVADMSADDIEAFNEETGEIATGAESSTTVDVTGSIAGLSPDDIEAWEKATGEPVADGYDAP